MYERILFDRFFIIMRSIKMDFLLHIFTYTSVVIVNKNLQIILGNWSKVKINLKWNKHKLKLNLKKKKKNQNY